uniref:Putative secreted protein n=1 Tax=Anopheles darlingi TaxID=43151 RepID=A0A2M4DDG0_ANODA
MVFGVCLCCLFLALFFPPQQLLLLALQWFHFVFTYHKTILFNKHQPSLPPFFPSYPSVSLVVGQFSFSS